MPLWTWVGIGAVCLLALSTLVGLAVAAILGSIGREITDLLDVDSWRAAPLTRLRESAGTSERGLDLSSPPPAAPAWARESGQR